jgi:hypothetical protein
MEKHLSTFYSPNSYILQHMFPCMCVYVRRGGGREAVKYQSLRTRGKEKYKNGVKKWLQKCSKLTLGQLQASVFGTPVFYNMKWGFMT